MLQLPTGAGKTVLAMAILDRMAPNPNPETSTPPAAWITHRRELEEQTAQRGNESGVSFGQLRNQKGTRHLPSGSVTLISPQIRKRPDIPDTCGLLVVDEAHHSVATTWQSWISKWPGPVLGLTATPARTNPKVGFNHLFKTMISGPQIRQLISEGYLAQPLLVLPEQGSRIPHEKLAKARGDYTPRSAETAVLQLLETGLAAQEFRRLAKIHQVWDQPTLWFAPTKESATRTVTSLRKLNATAEVLLENTPVGQRKQILDGFRQGNPTHVVSVDILGEGLDVPDCRAVATLRPTLSISKYLQMVGRGTRPKPDGGPVYVFDFAANYAIHGLPDQDREWSLAPLEEQTSGGQIPPEYCRQCPWCALMFVGGYRTCPAKRCGNALGYYCSGGVAAGRDVRGCGRFRYWQWFRSPVTATVNVGIASLEETVEDNPLCKECIEADQSAQRRALLEAERKKREEERKKRELERDKRHRDRLEAARERREQHRKRMELLAASRMKKKEQKEPWRPHKWGWYKPSDKPSPDGRQVWWWMTRSGELTKRHKRVSPDEYDHIEVMYILTAWDMKLAEQVIADYEKGAEDASHTRRFFPGWKPTQDGKKQRLVIDNRVWLYAPATLSLLYKDINQPWKPVTGTFGAKQASKIVAHNHRVGTISA